MKFTIAAATTLAFVYAESAFGLSIDTPYAFSTLVFMHKLTPSLG